MNDVQEWQPLELPVPVVTNGRATTYEEQIAYFERHPDFEQEFRDKLKALWKQYASKGVSELEADLRTLQEHVRRLEAVTEDADTLHPERSDPDALPDGIGMTRWKSLSREERIRLYEKCQRTLKAVRFRLSIVRNVLWRESMHGDRKTWGGFAADEPEHAPVVITGYDAPEVPAPAADEAPAITGPQAPEYALEARDVLKEHPAISSFSKLAGKIGEPTVSGSSKVDTLKRATGYDDLPRAEKDFTRFRELLLAGAARLEG